MVGVNPNVKPGVRAVSEKEFVYACGSNLVVHNLDRNEQRYILSIEGSLGITGFEISPCKRYLAVCERSTQAICVVYELSTMKRKRILTSAEIAASEFTSIAFATS